MRPVRLFMTVALWLGLAVTCRAQLITGALSNVVADIDSAMVGSIYPDWDARVSSTGMTPCTDILSSADLRYIPTELLADAAMKASQCKWQNFTFENGTPGRVAFLIANCSGMLDANLAGGAAGTVRTNINELNLSVLTDIDDVSSFYSQRAAQGPYESIVDLVERNSEVSQAKHLITYSYDPGPNQYFYTESAGIPAAWYDTLGSPKKHPKAETAALPPKLGQSDAPLTNKFNINSITNYSCYGVADYSAYSSDSGFMNNYCEPLKNILTECGFIDFADSVERPLDVTWNIINYLDTDRIPHAGVDVDGYPLKFPYTYVSGGEAVPLINEIVFERTVISNNIYRIRIELWFPFAPVTVSASDGFLLKAGIYTTNTESAPMSDKNTIAADTDILSDTYTYQSQEWPIPDMKFGTSSEFRVFEFSFSIPDGGGDSNNMAISRQDPVYFYCQVRKQDTVATVSVVNPVDDAMGYSDGSVAGQGTTHKRALFPLGATDMSLLDWGFESEGRGYSVCDPRANNQVKYWTDRGHNWSTPINGHDYPPGEHTLGTINANCDAYAAGRSQGLPIFHRDAPMRSVTELGSIFRSLMDDDYGVSYSDYWYWQTINLMHANEGARLLDVVSTTWDVKPKRGVVNINTDQKEVLRTLFYNMPIGPTNCAVQTAALRPLDVALIVEAISSASSRPWATFQDMFTDDGQHPGDTGFSEGGGYRDGYNEVAKAIRTAVKNSVNTQLGKALDDPVADIYTEDVLRKFCDLISFRQNIFTVVVAAQALGPDPDGPGPLTESIAGEERAVVTLFRDSYSGSKATNDVWKCVITDIHYVSTNGLQTWPYGSWDCAASTIDDAVGVAGPEDAILVSNSMHVLSQTIVLTNGMSLIAKTADGPVVLDGGMNKRCLYLSGTNVVVDGLFVLNGQATNGANVYIDQNGTIRNCVIALGSAVNGGSGGGVYLDGGGRIESCSVVSNSSEGWGAGVYCDDGGTVRNSILHNNSAGRFDNWCNGGSGGSYAFCSTIPLPDGSGHVSGDPMLKSFAGTAYYPAAGSPCIDAGENKAWMTDALDAEGKSRIINTNVDIGAVEHITESADSDSDTVPDWWEWQYTRSFTGVLAIIDMDFDGMSSADEYRARTHPYDRNSLLDIKVCTYDSASSGQAIAWDGVAGVHYRLRRSTNLVSWTVIPAATNISGADVMNVHTDLTAVGTGPFFYHIEIDD